MPEEEKIKSDSKERFCTQGSFNKKAYATGCRPRARNDIGVTTPSWTSLCFCICWRLSRVIEWGRCDFLLTSPVLGDYVKSTGVKC